MFENEKDLFGDFGSLDLGSDLEKDFAGFTPLDDGVDMSTVFGDEKKEADDQPETITAETPAENAEQKQEEVSESAKKDDVAEVKEHEGTEVKEQQTIEVKEESVKMPDTEADLFEQVVAQAETKQAESIKNGLTDKLPIFSYANAKEEIVDTSKTFDQLREEKAEDFPELDDSGSVSWKMVYGTITKNIANPKKTTIASMKKEIENSKAFLDSLKKAKGEIECKVTPTVTAKKKGVASAYKGMCTSVTEAIKSNKVISFVPSSDGRVYEIRKNKIGAFIAPADYVSVFDKVKAGFVPALPKIPNKLLEQVITFFRTFISDDGAYEAIVYIYWSVEESKYYIFVPKQQVSGTTIDTTVPELDEDKYILAMEIHSHNNMIAEFSETDNKDEKVTRLYTVIGRLNKMYPDINTRISVGGKHVNINPAQVFEGINAEFPEKWKDSVEIKKPLERSVIE